MNLEYFFFDLDGTLINNSNRLHTLFNDLVGNDQVNFDSYWSYKREMKNNSWLLKTLLGYSDDMITGFQEQWMSRVEDDHYLAMDVLFDDTVSCLEKLQKQGELYVVTSRQFPVKVSHQLEELGIAHFFSQVLVTEQQRTKETVIRSLKLELTSNNSVIIGDTGEETLAGRALGIYTVSTLTGSRSREVLESYQPDLVVNDLSALCDALLA